MRVTMNVTEDIREKLDEIVTTLQRAEEYNRVNYDDLVRFHMENHVFISGLSRERAVQEDKLDKSYQAKSFLGKLLTMKPPNHNTDMLASRNLPIWKVSELVGIPCESSMLTEALLVINSVLWHTNTPTNITRLVNDWFELDYIEASGCFSITFTKNVMHYAGLNRIISDENVDLENYKLVHEALFDRPLPAKFSPSHLALRGKTLRKVI